MASERIQRQINHLLDESEEAIAKDDWAVVRERAQKALVLDPEHRDALDFLAAAERVLGGTTQAPSAPTTRPGPSATQPSPTRTERDAADKLSEGMRLLGDADDEGAVAAFTDSIALNPNQTNVYRHRALAYRNLGREHEAEADSEKAASSARAREGELGESVTRQARQRETIEPTREHSASRSTASRVLAAIGIVLTVSGGALGLYAYSRYTSIIGQFHTFTPPFTAYETITLVTAGIGMVLTISGLTTLILALIKVRETAEEGEPVRSHRTTMTRYGSTVAGRQDGSWPLSLVRQQPLAAAALVFGGAVFLNVVAAVMRRFIYFGFMDVLVWLSYILGLLAVGLVIYALILLRRNQAHRPTPPSRRGLATPTSPTSESSGSQPAHTQLPDGSAPPDSDPRSTRASTYILVLVFSLMAAGLLYVMATSF